MHAIPTRRPLATVEAALKTPDFWPVLTALERCALHDPAFIRAIGGPEFETLIANLSLARHERWKRERRKHRPAVRRDDER
jgi:hypothetical protein